ncbi:MAG: helix-hairpin-helix domain-containing protein [Zoogloeaceae bacterium]|nr:helix-hairpin-helix domain-containing protein [Zoogloeaceae bacterium]
MIATALQSLVVRHPAARFAGTQGYRLEGDQAHLNATVDADSGCTGGSDWALQLWACDSQNGQTGVKVAEVTVGLFAGTTDVEGWATALPPAGHNAHTMVLALARRGGGEFDQIHDLSVFPAQESFTQPRLDGTVGYRFADGSVSLEAGGVTNARDALNVSGSLRLELWALANAYQGGAFEGFLIAGADLGSVGGQQSFGPVQLTLPAAAVPAGSWHLALMLREWTTAGFVTRDYANFVDLYSVADQPALAAAPAVVEAAAPAAAAVHADAKSGEAPQAAAKPATKAAAGRGVKATKAAADKGEAKAESGRVSINQASLEALVAVKGLSKAVASAIVASRPYASLEDLLRAKGVGAKLLDKIRDQLSL